MASSRPRSAAWLVLAVLLLLAVTAARPAAAHPRRTLLRQHRHHHHHHHNHQKHQQQLQQQQQKAAMMEEEEAEGDGDGAAAHDDDDDAEGGVGGLRPQHRRRLLVEGSPLPAALTPQEAAASAAAAAAAASAGTPPRRGCAAHDGRDEPARLAAEAALNRFTASVSALTAADGDGGGGDTPSPPPPPAAPEVIETHFHIVTTRDANGTGVGVVTRDQVDEQLAVLNAAYAAAGLRFELASAREHRVAPERFTLAHGSPEERALKRRLRRGGKTALNVYTLNAVDSWGIQLLGWATFPWDFSNATAPLDGVVLHHGTMPRGAIQQYNLGATAVHEIGHWFGLLHTFEGGCAAGNGRNGGDYVADTPAEATAANGCPTGRDTCPDLPGLDPVSNFMDYSQDDCMTTGFTPGQRRRIRSWWQFCRKTAACETLP